jgi:hypothetical protein
MIFDEMKATAHLYMLNGRQSLTYSNQNTTTASQKLSPLSSHEEELFLIEVVHTTQKKIRMGSNDAKHIKD